MCQKARRCLRVRASRKRNIRWREEMEKRKSDGPAEIIETRKRTLKGNRKGVRRTCRWKEKRKLQKSSGGGV